MANAYVSSVAYAAVAQWAATTAYTVGQYRRQLATPAVGSERVFRCSTAGTSGGSEPSWTLTNNGTTNDGTAVWTQCAGQEAHQSAGNWTAPCARVNTAVTLLGLATGDTVFVSNDHAETAAAAVGLGSTALIRYLSVSRVGASLPPASADLTVGASLASTGANSVTVASGYFYGFTLSAASGSSNGSVSIAPGTPGLLSFLDSCALILNTTSVFASINTSGTFHTAVRLRNTTMQFGTAGQVFSIGNGQTEWIDGGGLVGPTYPTNLVGAPGGNASHANLLIDGVDLSAISGGLVISTLAGEVRIVNCRLHASVTPVGASLNHALASVRIHNCDSSSTSRNYRFMESYAMGNVVPDVAVLRTGGASDGVTPLSHKFTTVNTPYFFKPLIGNWISKRQNTVGGALTCTVEIISGLADALKNNEFWIEAESLDSSSYPLGTYHTSAAADVLNAGTTLTASTEAWDSAATSRADSTAYTLGNIRKVSSNSGRLFVCSTAGTSGGSLPGGYATAVDGDTVADGTAVFRAMWRQKASVSFTPQMQGIVRARANVSLAAASIVWVDPKLSIA